MQSIQLNIYGTFNRIFWLICQAAPRELVNLILFSIVTGSGPSVALFFSKIVIDELTRFIGQANLNAIALVFSEPRLIFSLASMLLLNILVDSLRPINNILLPTFRDAVEGYVKAKVISKVANFTDIALFETPSLLNKLKLAERGVQDIQELVYIIPEAISGVLVLIPSVLLSCSISWWIPLLLIASSIPSTFVELIYTKKSWALEETQADSVRHLDIYASLMLSEIYAKEIRLFSLQHLLIERWIDLYYSLFQTMKTLRFQGAIASFLCSLIEGVGIVIPYIYIVFGVLRGNYSLGDLALYTGLILQIRIGLRVTLSASNSIYDVLLSVRPIFQLLSLEPSIVDGTESIMPVDRIKNSDTEGTQRARGIQIRGLTFTYPGQTQPTLYDINLSIRPQEMVVLVGQNGSGKTTLAKLLCRLYDPQQGSIMWNEQNFKSLSLTELRSHIAVLMQDYARFPTNLRENVGWGCLPKLSDNVAIQDVLEKVGMVSLINTLDKGLSTPLSKQLEDGVDLSGGQWQRIAIARTLLRLSEADLLIFDEPTAAIDPKNEHEIYQIFREIAKNLMTVVISHRLGLAKIADRILVMDRGQIVEEGTHEALMNKGASYYTMFSHQMSYYT
jgi:ATP-binding cassette subfamily B protein